MATHRNQPSYDFLSGDNDNGSSRLPHSTMRQSSRPNLHPTSDPDALIARIKALEYELSTAAQEKELADITHATELRDAHTRAESDFRKSQAAEQAARSATAKAEKLEKEEADRRDEWEHERGDLERKVRNAMSEATKWREECEEEREKGTGGAREIERKMSEMSARYKRIEREAEAAKEEAATQKALLESVQIRLGEREAECGEWEQQVMKYKRVAGDAENVALLKRDVSEQVQHIRKLEGENRELKNGVAEMTRTKKSVDVVEEEKRSLETRLRLLEGLSVELEEVRMRNEAMENEKRQWSSYLDSQNSQDAKFDSPEDLVRAFMQERLEKASLLNRIGELQPEVATKDETIQELEEEKKRLKVEIETLKQQSPESSAPTAGDPKARARLERQKNLAFKETEYLRAQLKTLDAEEAEMNSERYQESQTTRITELEALVDEYRKEMETLQSDMANLESSTPATASLPIGNKRPREEPSDERVGELVRKQRTLQDSLSESQTRIKVLESELKAKSSQLSSLRSSSRLRVLEFKDNPTNVHEAIKKAQLDALQSENETLYAQIEGRLPTTGASGANLVPKGTLERLQLELTERDATIASRDKSLARLKDIFRAKGFEFKDAVFSLLGWNLAFQPNGKVKASSMFYPSARQKAKQRGEEPDGEDEFIEFDGENGTMKVSGGPQSEFAKEIRGLIEFWVDGKGQVPCFLAAMTLEFYEKYGENMARK
jgi:mitotic spindle assembly checkpoint protein MAD1